MGPCPWSSSLGAVLAALAAQEGREQGPGEGGGKSEDERRGVKELEDRMSGVKRMEGKGKSQNRV